MSETIHHEQKQSLINEQVEQFFAIFSDLRRVMGAGFKHAHQHGFSTTQFMVMGLIERCQAMDGEACTISGIAGRLGIDPTTVVRTVDSLEKRGLVERRRDRQDRRQVFVEFTDAGRAALLETHRQFITRVRTIFLAMSAEGRTSLLSGLDEFVQVGLGVQKAPVEQEREAENQISYS
ncbi:MAG TPA: MarR family winged helix-turn-helix transcriptional regulator [Ktedonobacteraceae bacterium]|nr:MarR family winged helix-turn-helix transcriptional regulator [Ktedonobacteraceae bacterium]